MKGIVMVKKLMTLIGSLFIIAQSSDFLIDLSDTVVVFVPVEGMSNQDNQLMPTQEQFVLTDEQRIQTSQPPLSLSTKPSDVLKRTRAWHLAREKKFEFQDKGPLACPEEKCSATFHQKNDLIMHQQERCQPFRCTWQDCTEYFTAWSALRTHIRRHKQLLYGAPYYASRNGNKQFFRVLASQKTQAEHHDKRICTRNTEQ